jgi:hypothetical protein
MVRQRSADLEADRCFESCQSGIRYVRTPCDQAALLNALDTPVLIGSAASVATC